MRLIQTTTLKLHDFTTQPVKPEYAILSHCWGADEVTFADFNSGANQDGLGYKKIIDCCALACSQGLEWAWVDTCCIDKTSSAELSEAINSMFTWYKKSSVCFAFLPDYKSRIPAAPAEPKSDSHAADQAEIHAELNYNLSHSRWFTRGWTLQELVAPGRVIFYDQDGIEFGDKYSLLRDLSTITGIPRRYLFEPHHVLDASVACRMSWASHRVTTRPEDLAYCLLGIFDVNMPLLYGEGNKAFLRLQEHILQQSADDSLFAWQMDELPFPRGGPRGILASSPRHFAKSGDIIAKPRGEFEPPIRLTNKGIELPLRWAPGFLRLILGIFMPPQWFNARSLELACRRFSEPHRRLTIVLQKDFKYESLREANQYFRVDYESLSTPHNQVLSSSFFRWLMTSGGWVNHYVAPWTHHRLDVLIDRNPMRQMRWSFRFSNFVAVIGTFLFPALAALANWRYDNPMLVVAIFLLGYSEHLKANVRVVFALILVLSGNLGIGPAFSATERQH